MELSLPVANGAALRLKQSGTGEWLPSVIWEAALITDGMQPLGGATIDQCKRGLLNVLERRHLKFFPASADLPEHVGVMSFYDHAGPLTRLFVLRVGDDQYELAWQEQRGLRFHRTGVIIDDACVDTWPELLESGARPSN